MILSPSTRDSFQTLLSAVAYTSADSQRPAITFVRTDQPPVSVTRLEFQSESARMAGSMHSLGISPGDVVVIAHTQDLETIFLFWGAMQLGAIPTIFHTVTEKISPELYFSDMPALIQSSGAKAVFTTEDFAPTLAPNISCDVFGPSDLEYEGTFVSKQTEIDPQAMAFLSYSSGSTGAKKGIPFSHSAVLNQIASYSSVLEITSDDTIVSWMPLYHDGGLLAGHLLPLVQGIPLVLMSPFDWVKHPGMLFQAISEHGGTHCWLPNFAYNHCARRVRDGDLEGASLETMKAFVNAAEPVRESSHQMFFDRFGPLGLRKEALTVMYGMAENVLAITQTSLASPPRIDVVDRTALEEQKRAVPVDRAHPEALPVVSCGRAIPGVELSVAGDSFEVLPERAIGEFIVRGDSLFEGYYKRPDLYPDAFREGWHLSGDLGYMLDGEAFVIGRSKDLIIHAGKNIYPHDLEEIVGSIPGIHPGRVVAFGVEDEREGTELIAIIAEADTTDPNERQTLGQVIRSEIAAQTTVTAAYVEILDRQWIIKTSSGKIPRDANRSKWLAEREQR